MMVSAEDILIDALKDIHSYRNMKLTMRDPIRHYVRKLKNITDTRISAHKYIMHRILRYAHRIDNRIYIVANPCFSGNGYEIALNVSRSGNKIVPQDFPHSLLIMWHDHSTIIT